MLQVIHFAKYCCSLTVSVLCRSEMLGMVDNFAILALDIAWCYLALHAVAELPDADIKLQR